MKLGRNISIILLLTFSFGCKVESLTVPQAAEKPIDDSADNKVEAPKSEEIKIPELKVDDTEIPEIKIEAHDASKHCYDNSKQEYQCVVYAKPIKATGINKGGKISGYAWTDYNKNGIKDSGEPHSQSTIYIDTNNNCSRDAGEPSVSVGNPTGYYEITPTQAAPFPETVAIVRVQSSSPLNSLDGLVNYKVDLNPRDEFTNLNFSFSPQIYSESTAPASYGLARHKMTINVNHSLGLKVRASGGSKESCPADGVTFLTPLKFGTKARMKVISGQSTFLLIGWMDFNANGQFDASERIVGAAGSPNGIVTREGESFFEFDIPANATGQASVKTWARFRYGLSDANPWGLSTSGEVEDYEVTISN